MTDKLKPMRMGAVNRLEVARLMPQGAYLTDGTAEVLLPRRYVAEHFEPGTPIDVFLYLDSDDRPVATTERPFAQVQEFAVLEVKEVTRFGAFLHWGLPKDLLVPFREQHEPLQKGEKVLVYVYIDSQTGRIVATAKASRHFVRDLDGLAEGEEVEMLVYQDMPLGYRVVADNRYSGMVFKSELRFGKVLEVGQHLLGYVGKLREDGKLDLLLTPVGAAARLDAANQLLEGLKASQGFLPLTDDSQPEEIDRMLGMSKKLFKKALGTLYKRHQVAMEPEGIRLLQA